MAQRRISRIARWAVPAGAAATAGLVAAGTVLASAQTAPRLPARTPAQLLASAQRAAAGLPPPLTGTITETADLGVPSLPSVPGLGGVSSALSLLSGSHTARIWYAGPAHVRIAVPAAMGETDLRRDGRQVWLWRSSDQTATHLILPARSGLARPPSVPLPASGPAMTLTPQQAARRVLAAAGPTTVVRVQRSVMVAGQAAYQLRISPRSSKSLIGQIRIAVDAANSMPLRLQVFARGAASPAFQLGFTALSLGRPAAGNFTFSPPPGAKVHQVRLPAQAMLPARLGGAGLAVPFAVPGGAFAMPGPVAGRPGSIVVGPTGWIPASRARVILRPCAPHAAAVSPGTSAAGKSRMPAASCQAMIVRPGRFRGFWAGQELTPAQVRKMLARLRRHHGWVTAPIPARQRFPGRAAILAPPRLRGLATAPRVIGKGWLSVLVIPAGAGLPGLLPHPMIALPLPLPLPRGSATYGTSPSVGHTSTATLPASPAAPRAAGWFSSAPAGLPGPYAGALRLLMKATVPVHGAWGSGRLLRTALLSVLITSKGDVLAGAVTPQVLYAAAAHVR